MQMGSEKQQGVLSYEVTFQNLRRDAKKLCKRDGLSVKFWEREQSCARNHLCPFCFTGEPLPESEETLLPYFSLCYVCSLFLVPSGF